MRKLIGKAMQYFNDGSTGGTFQITAECTINDVVLKRFSAVPTYENIESKVLECNIKRPLV